MADVIIRRVPDRDYRAFKAWCADHGVTIRQTIVNFIIKKGTGERE